MAWLAVDKNNDEHIYNHKPSRIKQIGTWCSDYSVENDEGSFDDIEDEFIKLPTGSIEKLIGKQLTWEDEPVEIK